MSEFTEKWGNLTVGEALELNEKCAKLDEVGENLNTD